MNKIYLLILCVAALAITGAAILPAGAGIAAATSTSTATPAVTAGPTRAFTPTPSLTHTRQPTITPTSADTPTPTSSPTITATPDWTASWLNFARFCADTGLQRDAFGQRITGQRVTWEGRVEDINGNSIALDMADTNLCRVFLDGIPQETLLKINKWENVRFEATITSAQGTLIFFNIRLDDVNILWHGIPTSTPTLTPTITPTVKWYFPSTPTPRLGD